MEHYVIVNKGSKILKPNEIKLMALNNETILKSHTEIKFKQFDNKNQ